MVAHNGRLAAGGPQNGPRSDLGSRIIMTESPEPEVTAAILVIGDEILSGRTKDKNIGYIAEYLTSLGIDLKEVRVVGDDADLLEVDAERREVFGDIADVLVLGAPGQDLVADHQDGGGDFRLGRFRHDD